MTFITVLTYLVFIKSVKYLTRDVHWGRFKIQLAIWIVIILSNIPIIISNYLMTDRLLYNDLIKGLYISSIINIVTISISLTVTCTIFFMKVNVVNYGFSFIFEQMKYILEFRKKTRIVFISSLIISFIPDIGNMGYAVYGIMQKDNIDERLLLILIFSIIWRIIIIIFYYLIIFCMLCMHEPYSIEGAETLHNALRAKQPYETINYREYSDY